MANSFFEKMLADLIESNGGESEVITELRALGETLSEDATPDEVFAAVQAHLDARIAAMGGEAADAATEDEEEEPVDEEYMENACNAVKAFIEENDWRYRFNRKRPDLSVFELGFTIKGCSLTARIHIEDNPKVCCIDAVLPITADPIYEYIVCKEISKLNYSKRYGAFKHDERDGEITYEYTFQIGNGIDTDQLDTAFHAVVQTAAKGYPDIRKCCVGKFKGSEVAEILSKLEAIIDDLSDDE